MILLVTYDLKGHAGGYQPFYNALQEQGPWWHYLATTWLLSTTKSPKDVFDALLPALRLDLGDRLLITRLGDYWGWLPKDAWEWIEKNK
jgi:hypothetical protein